MRHYSLSILLHISILLLVLFNTSNDDASKGASLQDSTEVEIITKDQALEAQTLLLDPGEDIKQKPRNADVDCPNNWYGGIGVMMSANTVERTYEGYPADIAGIKSGDIIQAASEPDIRGEPGTQVVLTINRQGVILIITVIRDKICYNTKERDS